MQKLLPSSTQLLKNLSVIIFTHLLQAVAHQVLPGADSFLLFKPHHRCPHLWETYSDQLAQMPPVVSDVLT